MKNKCNRCRWAVFETEVVTICTNPVSEWHLENIIDCETDDCEDFFSNIDDENDRYDDIDTGCLV